MLDRLAAWFAPQPLPREEEAAPAPEPVGVCWCADEQLVPWPGYYLTVNVEGRELPDPDARVEPDDDGPFESHGTCYRKVS